MLLIWENHHRTAMSYSNEIISLKEKEIPIDITQHSPPQSHLEGKENQATIRSYDFTSEENEVTCTKYLRKRKCKPLCIIQPNITPSKTGTTVINLPSKQANISKNNPQKTTTTKNRMLFLY